MVKKILKISGIVILALLLTAIALPFIFKDKIIAKVKTEANKNLNAVLDFKNLDLSFIRSFPNVSIQLEDLSLIGIGEFEKDTLISAESLRITTDIMSAIRGEEIQVKSVRMNKARISAKVLKDGKANWDITKPSPETPAGTEEPSSFKAALQQYSITDSRIRYEDIQGGIYMLIDGLNHEGSGDFTADQTNLDTKTSIAAMDVVYGGIPYFNRASLDYKAAFFLDLKNSNYEFKENELRLNDLFLNFSGKIGMPGNDITMDIKYAALKNDVKNFISIIPGTFTKDFDKVKSSGKLAFDGTVKGTYNEKVIPGFTFNLLIENGMVQYPGLPRNIKNIQVKAAIACPGGSADKTVIDVPVLHVDLGQFPIDAKIHVKTPVSDPDVDISVKGNVDLATLKDVIPQEAGTALNGKLQMDANFKGRVSALENEKYDQFYAAGSASLSGFKYASKDLPDPVSISTAMVTFNPKSIDLKQLNLTTGKSDINATGSLENYLAYFLKDKELRGNVSLNSNYLDLNPFMTESQPASADTKKDATADAEGYIRVPSNLDFNLKATINKLAYDNMVMNTVSGLLKVKGGVVSMNDLKMLTLGGSLAMNGTYDTRSEAGPYVYMDLNIKDADVKQLATTFNTINTLAPVAKNTNGNISVENFKFSMRADKAFNPILTTVNGSGRLKSSSIEIEGFEMVKKTAEALKIDKLKKWKLEKVNIGFTIVNGEVIVEPFDTQLGNYKATIAGKNGLDKSIDYAVNIEIPKAEFGGAANSVLNSLTAKANAAGIKGSLPDIIPVAVHITGTFDNPKIGTDLKSSATDVMSNLKKEAEAKAKEEFDKRKKELEDKANEEKERLKKDVEDRVKTETDKAKQAAEQKAKEEKDRLKKQAEEEAKKGINKLFKNK